MFSFSTQTNPMPKSTNSENKFNEIMGKEFLTQTKGKPFFSTFWDEQDPYYIKPKYKHIKEEMIIGPFQLSTQAWNNALRRAQGLHAIIATQITAKNRPKWNKICGIKPREHINMKYMVTMVLYSDFDQPVRQLLVETIQSNDYDKTAEIAHFIRYLIQSVNLFGQEMWDKTIYHGCCNPEVVNLLDTVNATLYYPLHTTLSKHVADNLGKWLCIRMERGDAMGALYLVEFVALWDEQVCIVYGGPVNIKCIQSVQSSTEHVNQYLGDLQFVQKVVKGSFLVDTDGKVLDYEKGFDHFDLLLNNYVYQRSIGHHDHEMEITQEVEQRYLII